MLYGWFLQTSVPHIPKMALCFLILKRGSATASILLLRESGAQWNKALQESVVAGGNSHCTISREQLERDVDEYYRSSKISGLLKGTACFTSPRPPARGVDMLRNTWCASVGTELSNAPAAWARENRLQCLRVTR